MVFDPKNAKEIKTEDNAHLSSLAGDSNGEIPKLASHPRGSAVLSECWSNQRAQPASTREQEGSSGLGAWLQTACSWADGREHSHIWAGWEDDWMRARACSGRWSNGGTVALGNVGRDRAGYDSDFFQ
jgi:hypothetical protein